MTSADSFIPFHRPSIGEAEIEEVSAALRSGWITSGPRTAQFEREFAAYTGARHALAVNSCTAGLHLALAALDIGPGDEVITTPLTFCATVNTILQAGATPVLADVDENGNLDPESVKQAITARTRALLPVHLAGVPCRMDELWGIADRHNLRVVEDAAHAVGTVYRGAQVGSSGNASGYVSDCVSFSFYATKNLTTGEGGMVTTPHESLAQRMKVLCLHGISRDAWNRYAKDGSWFYEVTECGFKYNMSDIQAAIGIHQLRKQEEFIRVRTRFAEIYSEAFAAVDELEVPSGGQHRSSWHLYMLRLRPSLLSIDRSQFIQELKARGVGTSVHFIPIPLHRAYARHAGLSADRCPRAMNLYSRLLSLPLYPAMSEEQVRYVARRTIEVARQFRCKSIPALAAI